MDQIILKKYELANRDAIIRITESEYRDIFKRYAAQSIRLIVQNDSVVGWIHVTLPENSLYSGFVFIYIVPSHRRKGIASAVYKEVEKEFQAIGCDWWSSYPEYEAADKFALSVGFDYTNTNSYLEHNGDSIPVEAENIRGCRVTDYPVVPDLWSKEYALMHTRIGIPYTQKELSDAEKKEEFEEFCKNINQYFVLEVHEKIVGMGSLFGDNSGIGSLAVDHAYSGNGYGTRLAAFLTNECIRRGCKNPSLYCESGNHNAIHIYKKIGYVVKSKESVAVKLQSHTK